LAPDPHLRAQRLHGIGGSPPDLSHPPTGCRFNPRCPLVTDLCRTTEPPVVGSASRYARCWRPIGHGEVEES
jgi:oligopeptide/dipeptide ABC transporter ATP-binding protein